MQLFYVWVIVALIWLFIALLIANFYPLLDGGLEKIWIVLRGQKDRGIARELQHVDADHAGRVEERKDTNIYGEERTSPSLSI